MIELVENTKAEEGYFNIVIDRTLLSGAWAFKSLMQPDVPFQYVAKGERICWRLASQTLEDFDPFVVITLNNIFGWMISGHSIIISPDVSDNGTKERLTFGFYFSPDLAGWDFEFSFAEYCSEFYEVYEADFSSEYEFSLDETQALRIEFSSERFTHPIGIFLRDFESDLKLQHEITISRLTTKIGSKMVRTYFHFPEEIKSSCEQYLLYFGKFLQDLGIQTTQDLAEEEDNRVLFSVSPIDEKDALDKIREALAVYLHLPASPLIYNDSFASMRLQQQIENLQHSQTMAAREIQLAQKVIESQDKIIQHKDLTIGQQSAIIEHIISKSVMSDSAENSQELEEICEGLKIGESKFLKEQFGIHLNPASLVKGIGKKLLGKDQETSIIAPKENKEN